MAMKDEHQLTAIQISPADANWTTPGKEQQAAGVDIFLQIMMFVLSFVLGHVLRRHKFYYIPEAIASLLIGLIGWVSLILSNGTTTTGNVSGTEIKNARGSTTTSTNLEREPVHFDSGQAHQSPCASRLVLGEEI
ncbi:hypothetical protein ACFX2I_032542 [Malus domestica]